MARKKYPKMIYATWEGDDGPDGHEMVADASPYTHFVCHRDSADGPVRCGLYRFVGVVELHSPSLRVRRVKGDEIEGAE